jgi:hypothetical protein
MRPIPINRQQQTNSFFMFASLQTKKEATGRHFQTGDHKGQCLGKRNMVDRRIDHGIGIGAYVEHSSNQRNVKPYGGFAGFEPLLDVEDRLARAHSGMVRVSIFSTSSETL